MHSCKITILERLPRSCNVKVYIRVGQVLVLTLVRAQWSCGPMSWSWYSEKNEPSTVVYISWRSLHIMELYGEVLNGKSNKFGAGFLRSTPSTTVNDTSEIAMSYICGSLPSSNNYNRLYPVLLTPSYRHSSIFLNG